MSGRVARAEEIFPALQRITAEADLLLAEPDPLVFNGTTIQNILLTTYRASLPLVGFSPSSVDAGALLALYTTPTQVGIQAAEMAAAVLAGQNLPAPQWPHLFTVATNPHVARSLGLTLDSGSVLGERLHQLERQQ